MARGRPRKRMRSCRDDDAAGAEGALFPVGAEVEVRSDDPICGASYYEATVEGYQNQHSDLSYAVAYSTLSRRDGGDSPLREVAAAANVRPRQPLGPPPRRGFAVHDMVDAFRDGGWWAGVVISAVPVPVPEADTAQRSRSRTVYSYKVCFPTSQELLDFEETALRRSIVFLDDCWVSAAAAAKAKNGTPLFREGSQVEVSRSTETISKYWSPATVLKVIGASSFLVQYRDVREDGELVTEILDSQYIRPTRHMVHMDSKYRLAPSSPAEVFHEGSWWPGFILDVLDTETTKKYVVKIQSHEADKDEVECTDLLTVDNTQLRPRYDWYHGKWVLMEEKPVNRGPQSIPRERPASAVLAMASCNDSVDIDSLAPCIDNNDSISYESGSHLMEKVNKDVVSEPFWPDLVSNENDPTKHRASTCPEKVVKRLGTILPFESHLPTKHMTSNYPEKVVQQQGTMLSFKSHSELPSRSSATGFGNLKYDPKFCLSDKVERSSSQMVAKPSAPHSGQLQVSLFGSFGTLRPCPLPQTPSHTIKFGSILGSNKALAYHEKRSSNGRFDGMAGANQSTNFGSFSAFNDFAEHEEHGMTKQDHISAMVRYAAEGIIQLSSIGMSNCTEAQPDDTVIAPKGSEATPMSKFIPSRTHGSRDYLKRSRNVQGKESIIAERTSGSPDVEDVPFMKTSPLWAQIEAMEVFYKVPQRPNFHKCQQQVPELCEGMALGMMLSFANLAESLKRLCIEDEDAVFEEKMKGISLLEADGFNVDHLRSRLKTLLHIKKGRSKLQGTIKDLEKKFSGEETQRHTQISVLNMTIRQLELQALLFRRIMQSAISQEISDASEISRLKAEVSELEQCFSSATASPW